MVSIKTRRWELINRSTSTWVLSSELTWSSSVMLSTYLRICRWTSRCSGDPWYSPKAAIISSSQSDGSRDWATLSQDRTSSTMVMSTIYPIRQRRMPGLFESVKINSQRKSVESAVRAVIHVGEPLGKHQGKTGWRDYWREWTRYRCSYV